MPLVPIATVTPIEYFVFPMEDTISIAGGSITRQMQVRLSLKYMLTF
jgi:hypothetical protein